MNFFSGMKHFLPGIAAALFLAAAFSTPLRAQNPQSQEEKEKQEKQLLEYIDKEVQRLSAYLNLEYYQEFWVDSTLNHDLHAMREELEALQASKVSNPDFFVAVQDKWMQAIYDSYHRFLTEEQWKKYLKSGAAREQKGRDKRRAAREAKN